MISLFFVLRGSRTNRTLIRATGEDHFLLIILAKLKLFFQQKMGKQKLREAIFSVRWFAPIFSRPLLWAEKAVNFLNRKGQKRGATHSPRRSVFPLYVAKRCQKCKNVTLCQRVTETPCHIPTVDFYFYVYFYSTIATQNSDSAASQPAFRATLRIF